MNNKKQEKNVINLFAIIFLLIFLLFVILLFWSQNASIVKIVGDRNLFFLKLIIKFNPNVINKIDGEHTALCAASGYQWFEGVEFLLKEGASANQCNPSGLTPLHFSVGIGGIFYEPKDFKIINILLKNNANINARDDMGFTPIMYADNLDVVDYLVQRGADIFAKNNNGENLLMCALDRGADEDMIRFLLKKGININNKDDNGNNILHYFTGKESIIEFLIKSGIEINGLNKYGKTPLDVALDNKMDYLAAFLYSQGAKTGDELKGLLK